MRTTLSGEVSSKQGVAAVTMRAAQRAMAVAMINPEAEKGGRGKKNSLAPPKEFSSARLSQARLVFKNAPDAREQSAPDFTWSDQGWVRMTASSFRCHRVQSTQAIEQVLNARRQWLFFCE